jgi:hypothetical protein
MSSSWAGNNPAWKKQEKRVAQRRGGKQNPGSGSGWRKPNDVREKKVLWEMKQTGAKQITVKLTDWDKLRSNAILTGLMPAMHLQLGEGRGARRLVVISEDDFDELCPPQ